ncbi:hypothetical protein JW756_02935 [Candidatus Woesearchaeota archaeon]|nr:hypothetical protein [Candidatus Woesearchaeota archaeon]
MKKTIYVTLSVIIAVLLIITVVLAIKLVQQQSSLQVQKKQIEQYNQSLGILQTNYNALLRKVELLNQDNSNLTSQNQKLAADTQMQNEQINRNIDDIMDRLTDFETTIKASMDWFKNNNNIANFDEYKEMQQELKEKCLVMNDSCYIDLECIYEVNKHHFFTYQTDKETAQKDDFLRNLSSIYRKKGGDCEDFALVFTAEYNFLRDECVKQGFEKEKIIPFTEDNPIGMSYMQPVCGIFNPENNPFSYSGHCVVALTENPIIYARSIPRIMRDAVLVEPQIGEYVLDMNDTDLITIFKDNELPDSLYRLYTVITPDDLKIYYEYSTQIRWEGYSEFLEESNSLKKLINSG